MLTPSSQRTSWANIKLKSGRSSVKLILFGLFCILLINVGIVLFINFELVSDYLYVIKSHSTYNQPTDRHVKPVVVDYLPKDDPAPNALPTEIPTVAKDPVYPITASSVWREAASDSCGKQFGNGFLEEHKHCKSSGLSCHFNRDIVATHCVAQSLVIHPSKIIVSTGNETIESVRWRDESSEFPVYSPGAFSVSCEADQSVISQITRGNDAYRDHLVSMFNSFEYGKSNSRCDVTIEQALLLTRYEYANVYHQLTDVYNTFQAGNIFGKPTFSPSDLTIIFIDGHSQSAVDEYWTTLFTPNVKYVKQFPEGADNICINHAVFVSPGYGSALSPGMFRPDTLKCTNHPCMNDFAKFVQTQFRLDEPFSYVTKDAFGNQVTIDSSSTEPMISFATRRPYLSHPRVRLDATERVMRDEKETMQAIEQQLNGTARFYDWDFTRMSLRDQLRVLYASRVLIGLHGAALSHILYMKPSTALIEIIPPEYSARTHFRYFAAWSGHQYASIDISSSQVGGYSVNTDRIITACRMLVQSTAS